MTSSINPNNIDGTYPVPGVSNNTQGMRDNFNYTKTNFEYAADEITDLQSKAILKSALTGETLDNNMNDQLLYAAQLNDISYTEVQIAQTFGTVTLDYSAGMYQAIPNQTGNISLAFTNWPPSGLAGAMRFAIVVSNVSYTLTLPAQVNVGLYGIQGISPGTPGVTNTITFSQTGTYIFEFITSNSGTNISIFDYTRGYNQFSSVLYANAGIASSSTTTGSLVVTGGTGVSGNIYVGGLTSVTGNVQGGNIRTVGLVSATGNISGGNVNTTLVAATTVSASGNVTGGNVLTGGLISSTGNVQGGNLRTAGAVTATGDVLSSGYVLLNSAGTVGYGTGAGGTVTQSGNKSGGVTLSKPSGEITMQNTALGAATIVSFVLTNTTISPTDLMILNHVSGGTIGAYTLEASCGIGNATIYVRNNTGGSLSEALVLRYAIVKGAIS